MQGIDELQATGMPLGLFPEMDYEEGGTKLEPGDKLLLYSDGLVEAHNQEREMFGFGRLRELVEKCIGRAEMEDLLLSKLDEFTGKMWDQEDDVAFVSLQRDHHVNGVDGSSGSGSSTQEGDWSVLGEFSLPSEAGLERDASERVLELLGSVSLSKNQRDRLTTAVTEAIMNAIEHGNQFDPEKIVLIKVTASDDAVSVYITDQGSSQVVPEGKDPDLEAKLAGLESPRGWGLFIIRKMVDHFEIISSEYHHTIILTMFLGGEADAG
jgi:anti-sigma regulatory factor (Ser/Thr protein kinase)